MSRETDRQAMRSEWGGLSIWTWSSEPSGGVMEQSFKIRSTPLGREKETLTPSAKVAEVIRKVLLTGKEPVFIRLGLLKIFSIFLLEE